MCTLLLDRSRRLNKGTDIKRVLKEGTWINSRWFTIHYQPGSAPNNRWGIVVSKRVGDAVTRNLVKRRIREVCRIIDPRMPKKWDVVVIGRKGSGHVKFEELKSDFEKLCRRGRLL